MRAQVASHRTVVPVTRQFINETKAEDTSRGTQTPYREGRPINTQMRVRACAFLQWYFSLAISHKIVIVLYPNGY